jgi:hypothetical protein
VEARVSVGQPAIASSGRLLCWAESLILGLGIPFGIWAVSRLIALSIPAALHGSREQRFLLWILGGVIVEWSFVIVLWFLLRTRESSFRELGVWRLGTWPAWLLASLIAALSIASNLRFLLRMHIPVHDAFLPLLLQDRYQARGLLKERTEVGKNRRRDACLKVGPAPVSPLFQDSGSAQSLHFPLQAGGLGPKVSCQLRQVPLLFRME